MRLTDFEPVRLDELSPATLASYKKKAGAAATAADATGDTKTGNKRFSGIVKATKKQFDQDAKANKTNEAAPPGYDTATGKPLPPEARFDPNTGKPLPGVSPAPAAAAAPKQPWLPTSNKSKEAAYAAANKAKAAAPVAAPAAPATPAAAAPVAAPVAAPAAATPPRDTSKSIYDGDTGELTAYGAELKAKEKIDRQAAYAAAEANKTKAAAAAAPVAAPAAPTTTGTFQPRTTSSATNPAGKKVDIVQAANAAMAAGGNPEAAAIAAMKAKNPKLAAMMAQAGLDDQGNDIAAAPAAPAPVAEDALAGMKRLAGIASAQTQSTPGQRQYRHMPTAVQPR